MTPVQILLSDELATEAAREGLFSSEAMESMLREQLRRRAHRALQATWQRGPQDPLTAEIEQAIVDDVRTLRAERQRPGAR